MFIPRIFHPHPLVVGEDITFDKDTAHYLLTVLRLQNEAPVILFNGDDKGEYRATLTIHKKQVQAELLSFQPSHTESFLEIHLGQSLLRGDKMDFVIQKATELGVSTITPLITINANVKLDEARTVKRMQHWKNIAISAAEQSGRVKVPVIQEPLALSAWVALPFEGSSVVFSPTSSQSLKSLRLNFPMRIGIGPESGWDDKEIKLMQSYQFLASTLGPRILRTETAGMAALSVLQGLYGDLCETSFSTSEQNF